MAKKTNPVDPFQIMKNSPGDFSSPEALRQAQLNIEATKEAQKTDPSIVHVFATDPNLLVYETEEEWEETRKEIRAMLKEHDKLSKDKRGR